MARRPYGTSRAGARAIGALPPSATLAVRGDPADDIAPPVQPNLVRPRVVPGARQVGRNTIEILVFRGLSTPLALAPCAEAGRDSRSRSPSSEWS